jgi:hypothetical protein
MHRSERDRKRGIGKTVLVVDDNATIRKQLAHAFLSDGMPTQEKNGPPMSFDARWRAGPWRHPARYPQPSHFSTARTVDSLCPRLRRA